MNDMPSKFDLITTNQDLLRASILSLDKKKVVKALLWARNKAAIPFPTSIHLHLTLRCSAHCAHCKQWTWPSHREFDKDSLKKLFTIFNGWGIKTITFGGGNPLLHNEIIPALQMAHQLNLAIGIISEGIDMSNEMANAIVKNAQWIRFSLDGASAEIHDKLRNTQGLFNRVISNIKQLRTYNKQLKIGLNYVVQKSNISSISGMLDLASAAKVDTLLFKIPHGDDPSGNFLLSRQEWRQFVEWINIGKLHRSSVKTNLHELSKLVNVVFEEDDVIQGKPVHSFYLNEKVRCFAPLFFLTCDSEGNMFPCDYLQADTRLWEGKHTEMRKEFCLGNVLEEEEHILCSLNTLLKNKIQSFPAIGYDECGCCTRFCQLNAVLSKAENDLISKNITEETVTNYFAQLEGQGTTNQFL